MAGGRARAVRSGRARYAGVPGRGQRVWPSRRRATLRWPDGSLSESQLQALVGPGAPFELVEEIVSGAPLCVFAHRHHTLGEVLRSAADRFGERPYVIFPDRELSFSSTATTVASVARQLEGRYGVGKGDRVALASASCAEYVITLWAAISLGAVVVALNGWWTGSEMAHAVELTTPRVVLGDRRRLERLEGHRVGVATGQVCSRKAPSTSTSTRAPAKAFPTSRWVRTSRA